MMSSDLDMMKSSGIDANKLSFRRCVAAATISSGWIFFFAVRPTASETIYRCKGPYEGCDSAPLVTCSEGILTNLTFSRSLYKALLALS